MKKILFGTLALVTLFSATSCVKVNFDDGGTVVQLHLLKAILLPVLYLPVNFMLKANGY